MIFFFQSYYMACFKVRVFNSSLAKSILLTLHIVLIIKKQKFSAKSKAFKRALVCEFFLMSENVQVSRDVVIQYTSFSSVFAQMPIK